jgi:nitrogen-specific signal transduction histidine kinase/CheY-like chemotaxis protein
MTQVGLHSVSVDVGRAEGETSAVFDGQDCQSGKMEAFERLAAGVADDFNNLLTVIAGYSDLLLGLEELPADGRLSAQEIKHAAERAFTVTRQLLSFSRRDTAQPTLVALASLVEGMAPLLRRLLGEDIALDTVVSGEVPRVKADPVQIEWMFMNLAANARDAMPGGGSLRIEVQHVTRDVEAVVRVIVTDSGCGMDAATQAHLFEPFFTTNRPGQGAGLRLANVYGVVTQSHGAIRVSSEVGQGTSFTIDLPSATESNEQAEECGLQQAAPCETETVLVVEDERTVRTITHLPQGYRGLEAHDGFAAIRSAVDAGKEEATMTVETGIRTPHVLTGGLSVLVVDDEPSVRRLLGVLLHEYGYRARLAADGVEARSIVEMEDVALILCNVHVRDESGPALVRDLLRQSPRTVALMMSGSDESEPDQGTHEAGIYGHIAKPFDAKGVASRIARALCGRRLGGEPPPGEDALPWQQQHEFMNA